MMVRGLVARLRFALWAVPVLLLVAACGSAGSHASAPASSAPATAASPPAATAPPAAAAPSPAATPALVDVPDFRVVAYQGDEAFGGHEGHFRAAFARGQPVVLLYFAGL
jgi:hypothetical protein